MERTRPVFGSTTTTPPFQFPRASTAAARTNGSSPARLSSAAGSPYELTRQGFRQRLRRWALALRTRAGGPLARGRSAVERGGVSGESGWVVGGFEPASA